MESEIRDIQLAESGERKIQWVKRNCDLLRTLEDCPVSTSGSKDCLPL